MLRRNDIRLVPAPVFPHTIAPIVLSSLGSRPRGLGALQQLHLRTKQRVRVNHLLGMS